VRYRDPFGVGQRALSALALFVGISFAAHLAVAWLTPLIPLIVAVAVLISVWVLVFGRRRK